MIVLCLKQQQRQRQNTTTTTTINNNDDNNKNCTLNTRPVTDGVWMPEDPMKMLEGGKLLPEVSVLWGCNTNDSNLFVQEDYSYNVGAAEYTEYVQDQVANGNGSFAKRVLEMYPSIPASQNITGNRSNADIIGWLKSDESLYVF